MGNDRFISDEEFDRAWERLFGRDLRLPSMPAAAPASEYPFDLEDVVRRSIAELRKELGREWLSNRIFGTRLHAVVRKNIEAVASPVGWTITAETPLRALNALPPAVADMSLERYLSGPGAHLEWLRNEVYRMMPRTRAIGDLKPDLVIQGPDAVTTLWDLTSRQRTEHLAKTILYANLLARPNHLVRIGETYWVQRGAF